MNVFSLGNRICTNAKIPRNFRNKYYLDRVDQQDMSNRSFVMYHLSKYNNRHHFYYSETFDLLETEFRISKRMSAYERFYFMPVEYSNMAFSEFENYIFRKKCTLPVLGCEDWDVFSIQDLEEMKDIMETANVLYKAHMYQS